MRPDAMRRLPLEAGAVESWLAAGCGPAQAPVRGVVAILPAAETARLPVLQQACRQAGVALLGALFPRLIDGDALVDEGAWLLALPQVPAGFLIERLEDDALQAGDQVAEAARTALAGVEGPAADPRLLLVFDGQLPRIGSIVEQAYLQLDGRLQLLGVNAGDGSFTAVPCLFDSQRFIGSGVIGLLLPAPVHSALGMQPAAVTELYTVTASQDNRVDCINGRPAFEVYRELMAREHGIALTSSNFYEHAVHYPLALLRGDDQVLYRIPVALEPDGAITCIGEIPQFSLLSVLHAPAPEQMQCMDLLAQGLQPQQADGQLLVFYCAGRCQQFAGGHARELALLQQRLAPKVQAGALTLGEIGNTNGWGYPLFYNGALVGLGWNLDR